MPGKIGILVCENFSREMAEVFASERFSADILTFPPVCGQPTLNWERLAKEAGLNGAPYDRIEFICSACCVAMESFRESGETLRAHKLDQCFELFLDGMTLDQYLKERAYLVTPGWLGRWSHYLDTWGFDQDSAREFFGEFTSRLVLLDTGVHPGSADEMREFAAFLSLPYEIRPIGLDLLRLFLTKIILEWRLYSEQDHSTEAISKAGRQAADFAMAFDLIGRLTGLKTEEQAIEGILDLYATLFAPTSLRYLTIVDGKPVAERARPPSAADGRLLERSTELSHDYALDGREGFLQRISHSDETLGLLEVKGLAFPQYLDHYLNLSLTIARVCGLTISNARAYESLQEAYEAEHRIAQVFHEILLRPLPRIPLLDVGVAYKAAFETERLGGDFYDVFDLDNNLVCILVGDVSGKGVRAAGLTETIRSAVRTLAQIEPSPSFIFRRTNEVLLRQVAPGQFATATLLVLNISNGEATFANAGHPPAILCGQENCYVGAPRGFPLGTCDHPYPEACFRLRKSDCLVLYTDGLSEARKGREFFAENQLLASIAELHQLKPQRLAESLLEKAHSFAGGRLADDLVILAARRSSR